MDNLQIDMIIVLGYIILGIYLSALVIISIYCLMQFHLLFQYLTKPKNEDLSTQATDMEQSPFVTIQLPLYNEYFVVERLIDNIIKMDYPKDRFEIHVLDDSTDESVDLARAKVEEYSKAGFNIELITRSDRKGYKAGALKAGMTKAKGDFIAIFDADFLPKPDFLKRTIPFFSDEKVGVVQTRWAHINQGHSILTEVQAFQLNVHFTVEQKGRQLGDYLLQFNGTAGIWRRDTIEDAGGWSADTLTEDLDLSYRAQFKGWKIKFLEDTLSPAELPAEMYGLKSQQHRWMKGGAETAKKLLPKLWGSDVSLGKKLHGTIHLLGSSVFLMIFLVGVFSVPLLFLIGPIDFDDSYLGLFIISTFLIFCIYYVANVMKSEHKGSWLFSFLKFIFLFPIFLSLSMGLSLHNSVAVIQGYLGKKSSFVRTPKFNLGELSTKLRDKKYHKYKISIITIFEGLLTIYFLGAIVAGLVIGNGSLLAFHILLFFGYGTIFFFSIKHLSPS